MFEPALQIGVATGSVILLAWSSKDVLNGAVSLGTFVAFHEYIKRMVWPMAAIGSGLSLLQQGRSSYSRISDVLNTQPDVHDGGRRTLAQFDTLEVRNLTFTYPGATHPAISNLNFSLRRGEVLGIVGPVGSGKSTLVQLLGRIRPAPPQSIFVNGVAVEEFELSSWRGRLAVAPQDAFLFSRTVEDNILFGQAAVGAETVEPGALATADAVSLREEIEKLPLGFRAWLGEKGVNLSGGQRQRLTIARALAHAMPDKAQARNLAPADIVVLDDSLSAVDGKTEAAVLSSLRRTDEASAPTTAIIISHRLAAVTHADRILVLNEGRLEAIGTHAQLLRPGAEGSATYRRIHDLQTEGQP